VHAAVMCVVNATWRPWPDPGSSSGTSAAAPATSPSSPRRWRCRVPWRRAAGS